ncbi:hypothetical protein LZ31DRAFT_555888 [Colletotrichum somersetense]|nr:hypothetical protein LZ31DRAFT_555888 [Colletotrichum somersetense]
MTLTSSSPSGSDLTLPRILCLHGGGTNARIFGAQCRALRRQLGPSFRLVFADAPFPSPAGPDVTSVYGDSEWGPFRSWFPAHAATTPATLDEHAIASLDAWLASAIRDDDGLGATGKLIGLLGFSQGAKVAGSLLLRCQRQRRHASSSSSNGDGCPRLTDVCFAVLLAGRAPLLSMDATSSDAHPDVLTLPTVHVHGLNDAGLSLHRDLLHRCCDAGTARLVEWDGDHRVPIKTGDVAAVVAEVLAVAYETGALVSGHSPF